MSEKIRAEHLQRGAYIYVRQSTPYQVRLINVNYKFG
jgi:hypothetical protein